MFKTFLETTTWVKFDKDMEAVTVRTMINKPIAEMVSNVKFSDIYKHSSKAIWDGKEGTLILTLKKSGRVVNIEIDLTKVVKINNVYYLKGKVIGNWEEV